jgi:LPS sulfotransferase NodH
MRKKGEVPMAPEVSYWVCATVRSGSSLLCEGLKRTTVAGRPEEYFWHGMQADSFLNGWQGDDYAAYVRMVVSSMTSANGVFGTKMMGGYLGDFLGRLASSPAVAAGRLGLDALLAELFPNLRYIWLTRRNKVRQAVSWSMAIQTDRWSTAHPTRQDAVPEYRFEVIDHLLQELLFREAAWEQFFSDRHIYPLVVVYEDFRDRQLETVQAIFDYLGLALPLSDRWEPARLQKQADDLSEEWVQRFRREKQEGWWRHFW